MLFGICVIAESGPLACLREHGRRRGTEETCSPPAAPPAPGAGRGGLPADRRTTIAPAGGAERPPARQLAAAAGPRVPRGNARRQSRGRRPSGGNATTAPPSSG